jgi:hypothetical protein
MGATMTTAPLHSTRLEHAGDLVLRNRGGRLRVAFGFFGGTGMAAIVFRPELKFTVDFTEPAPGPLSGG